MPPLVSILIPCYNGEAFLEECVESALAQTAPNIEIIVVDDGSTDGSLKLARSYESRGVRVISQKNQGQSAAYNAAFNASTGHYIQYIDADDVLAPCKIEAQLARLNQVEPTAIASCPWARFQSKISEAVFKPERIWRDLLPADCLVEMWSAGEMMHVASWLIPRAIVLRAGPWNEALRWSSNIDGLFFTKTMLASSRCLFCSEAKAYYRSYPPGSNSLSSWKGRKNREATLQVLIEMGEALLVSENSDRTRRAYADNLQRFVFSCYPEILT